MPVPDYQSLMLPVLRFASDRETRVADVAEQIADELALSPEEREQLLPVAASDFCITASIGPNST